MHFFQTHRDFLTLLFQTLRDFFTLRPCYLVTGNLLMDTCEQITQQFVVRIPRWEPLCFSSLEKASLTDKPHARAFLVLAITRIGSKEAQCFFDSTKRFQQSFLLSQLRLGRKNGDDSQSDLAKP